MTHFSNNVDLINHNGSNTGLMLGGVLVTKTATQINQGVGVVIPAAAIAALSNAATGTEIATAVNALIAAIKAAKITL